MLPLMWYTVKSYKHLNSSLLKSMCLLAKFSHKVTKPALAPTIFALASGQGRCAVSVIRITGPNTKLALSKIARTIPEPRTAVLRKLRDPETDEILDKGLVLWFPSPQSYTGEDMCEFQIHGGPAVVTAVLVALHRLPNYRPSQPGEFTKRAFFSGKMDLTEVEGLADLLQAETEAQRRQAVRQADGALYKLYSQWKDDIIKVLAHIEAFIDFGEDQDLGNDVLAGVNLQVTMLINAITSHLDDGRRGERLRNGVNVAIVGEPNVGKSSLLNILCQRPAAIVSPYAGTTRDVLEVPLDIGGFPLLLCDTAGIRETYDPVESEGLQRAKRKAEQADLVILMMDASQAPHDASAYVSTQRQALNLSQDTELILLLNKLDLSTRDLRLPAEQAKLRTCLISCKTGAGIDQFLSTLAQTLKQLCADPLAETPSVTQARHRQHLQNCLLHLNHYLQQTPSDLSLAAHQLHLAARQIGHIHGRIYTENILDVLFSSFCIGK